MNVLLLIPSLDRASHFLANYVLASALPFFLLQQNRTRDKGEAGKRSDYACVQKIQSTLARYSYSKAFWVPVRCFP